MLCPVFPELEFKTDKPAVNLFIKNMVSIRCKMIVKSELDSLGLDYLTVDLGHVVIKGDVSAEQRTQLKATLLKHGLELLEDKKAMLIEKIKTVVVEMVHYADELPKINFSTYISSKLGHDYTYLSNMFSEVTGTTIEHFIIAHRIERVKELLVYDELNLTQISYKLGFSSVAHLSNQFKKITGLTPTFFKKMKDKRMLTLENVGKM
jgi:AraC-like DNA-binding protein